MSVDFCQWDGVCLGWLSIYVTEIKVVSVDGWGVISLPCEATCTPSLPLSLPPSLSPHNDITEPGAGLAWLLMISLCFSTACDLVSLVVLSETESHVKCDNQLVRLWCWYRSEESTRRQLTTYILTPGGERPQVGQKRVTNQAMCHYLKGKTIGTNLIIKDRRNHHHPLTPHPHWI